MQVTNIADLMSLYQQPTAPVVPAEAEEKRGEDDGFGDFDDFQAFEGQPPPAPFAAPP